MPAPIVKSHCCPCSLPGWPALFTGTTGRALGFCIRAPGEGFLVEDLGEVMSLVNEKLHTWVQLGWELWDMASVALCIYHSL